MLDGLNFGRLEILMSGKTDVGEVDIGGVYLRCYGRSFIVDTGYTESVYNEASNTTSFMCKTDLEYIQDTFGDDTDFDLNKNDLLDKNLKVSVYVEYDSDENKIITMKLEVKVDGDSRIVDCEEE